MLNHPIYFIVDSISTLQELCQKGRLYFKTRKGAEYYRKTYHPDAKIQKLNSINQYIKRVYLNA